MLQVGSSTITVMDGVISLAAGGSTITLDGAGLSHNGKNIGDNHAHGNVTPGQGQTGVPV